MPRQPLAELLEFLLHGSKKSLQQYMLKSLSESANLEKRIRELENELAELRAASLLAELLLHHGEEILCGGAIAPTDHAKNLPLSLDADRLPGFGFQNRGVRKATPMR